MRSLDVDELTLSLRNLDEVFVAPTPDLRANLWETRSGIEQLRDLVPPSGPPPRIELVLAGPVTDAVDPAQVERALAGYCTAEISRLDRERERVVRLGRKELVFGLIFLGVCLALSAATAAADISPEWLQQFFAEGLVIIGWIALWHPVDMLFFDRLPLVRDQRVLRRILQATVVITPSRDRGEG